MSLSGQHCVAHGVEKLVNILQDGRDLVRQDAG
jgi:hypothetical protein